jgi:pimeloyl-ACP methyl ester carboxylesterase
MALLSRGSGSVAFFVPDDPLRALVLAHGYPWPDGSRSDRDLVEYARAAVRRWTAFAEAHHTLIFAPAFGGSAFPRYQEMVGRKIDPDEFVNSVVDEVAAKRIRNFNGRFSLHGHSAGAQFAARYLVCHPQRLERAVLSAPSTYPFPDTSVSWPNGLGNPSEPTRPHLSGASRGRTPTPQPESWLAAASIVQVAVLVGSRDVETRPEAPGQQGSTRIERATAWVGSMCRYAEGNAKPCRIRLVMADGLDHDEEAMAVPAQRLLATLSSEP